MPSRLTFSTDTFQCHLRCEQCSHIKADGNRCRNRVCFGHPTCWIHSKQLYGVKTRPSEIHGKGLFTTRPVMMHDWICPYNGELIDLACLDARYPGDMTAPYTTRDGDDYYDGACRRGIGTMSNGSFTPGGRVRGIGVHNARISMRASGPWLRATKNIPANAEILTYYGREYRLEDNHETIRRSNPADNRPC